MALAMALPETLILYWLPLTHVGVPSVTLLASAVPASLTTKSPLPKVLAAMGLLKVTQKSRLSKLVSPLALTPVLVARAMSVMAGLLLSRLYTAASAGKVVDKRLPAVSVTTNPLAKASDSVPLALAMSGPETVIWYWLPLTQVGSLSVTLASTVLPNLTAKSPLCSVLASMASLKVSQKSRLSKLVLPEASTAVARATAVMAGAAVSTRTLGVLPAKPVLPTASV